MPRSNNKKYKKHKNKINKSPKEDKGNQILTEKKWNGYDEVEDWEIVDDIFGNVHECNVFWKLRSRKTRYEALEEKLNFTKSLFSENKDSKSTEMCASRYPQGNPSTDQEKEKKKSTKGSRRETCPKCNEVTFLVPYNQEKFDEHVRNCTKMFVGENTMMSLEQSEFIEEAFKEVVLEVAKEASNEVMIDKVQESPDLFQSQPLLSQAPEIPSQNTFNKRIAETNVSTQLDTPGRKRDRNSPVTKENSSVPKREKIGGVEELKDIQRRMSELISDDEEEDAESEEEGEGEDTVISRNAKKNYDDIQKLLEEANEASQDSVICLDNDQVKTQLEPEKDKNPQDLQDATLVGSPDSKETDMVETLRREVMRTRVALSKEISAKLEALTERRQLELQNESLQEKVTFLENNLKDRNAELLEANKEKMEYLKQLRNIQKQSEEETKSFKTINDGNKKLSELTANQSSKLREKTKFIELQEEQNKVLASKVADLNEEKKFLGEKINMMAKSLHENKTKEAAMEKQVSSMSEELQRLKRSHDAQSELTNQAVQVVAISQGQEAQTKRQTKCNNANCPGHKYCGRSHKHKQYKDELCAHILKGDCRHEDDCWRSHDISRFDLASYNIQVQVPMETDGQDSRRHTQATSSNQHQRYKRTPRRPSQDRAWRERNQSKKKEEEEIVRNLPQPVGYGNQATVQTGSPTVTQDQLEEFGNKIVISAVAASLAARDQTPPNREFSSSSYGGISPGDLTLNDQGQVVSKKPTPRPSGNPYLPSKPSGGGGGSPDVLNAANNFGQDHEDEVFVISGPAQVQGIQNLNQMNVGPWSNQPPPMIMNQAQNVIHPQVRMITEPIPAHIKETVMKPQSNTVYTRNFTQNASHSPLQVPAEVKEKLMKEKVQLFQQRMAEPRNQQLERIRQEDMAQRYMNPVQNPMPHVPQRTRFNSLNAVHSQTNNLNNHLQREERKRAQSLSEEFVRFQELPQDQRRM